MAEESSLSDTSSQQNPLIDQHIPIFMLKVLLYKCQIHTSRASRPKILVVTSGPYLHEVRDKEILRTCDLSGTILAGKLKVDSSITIN